MKTGQADLPLHGGKAPSWLFKRMVRISKPISEMIILEYGTSEYLKRMSDPYFFQAFGCALGFDWHSSGLTTTVTGALKLAMKPESGVMIAGGKGKTARKTKEDILSIGEKFNFSEDQVKKLIRSSKISAKVDNNLLQDSYQLYHHTFFMDEKGKWGVIQQGMNNETSYARRYHWLSDSIVNYVEEPHSGIISARNEEKVLDLTSKESAEARKVSLDLIRENPIHLKKYEKQNVSVESGQKSLFEFTKLSLPRRHEIIQLDLGNFEAMEKAYELQPKSYEDLILVKGFGGKTIRALALISNLVYGSNLSWKDPAKYSYAHGGKDGYPYPVNRELYDQNIELLNDSVKNAKLGYKDRLDCLRRMKNLIPEK